MPEITFNVSEKYALILKYLTEFGFANTNDDLLITMINDYIDKYHGLLKQNSSWRYLNKQIDERLNDKFTEFIDKNKLKID